MPKGPAKKSRCSELVLRAKAILNKCMPSKDTIINVSCCLIGLAALLTLVARMPEIHSAYLRQVVGSRVYKVQYVKEGGGGTGFQVRAPSGQDYVVTNSHVCNAINQISQKLEPSAVGSVLLVDDEGNSMRRRIIAISDRTDLCLIEGVPGVRGLSLGNEPALGDTATVVGHPHLRPITLSGGEIIGTEDVKILDYIMSTDNPMVAILIGNEMNPDGKCDMPKQETEDIQLPEEVGGGTVKVCLDVTYGAYMTSIVIYPGNSGSPMVDYMGRVVGVAFAGDNSDNYGEVVSFTDLKTFLARY
jgi:S1-C subfamily serine protease